MTAIALPQGIEITGRIIEYCAAQYGPQLRRFEQIEQHFDNHHAIHSRMMTDSSSPNNRLAHNFARYITNMATSYFMGAGIKYKCEDDALRAAVDKLMRENLSEAHYFEEAKEMSKCGVAYELLYINEAGELKTHVCKASEIIPIYSASVGRFLTAALRRYTVAVPFETPIEYIDLYTAKTVQTFRGTGTGYTAEGAPKPHNLADVPIIIRRNNAESKGDFEDVISLIDAYDRAQSDSINDLDSFAEAYLVVSGAEQIVNESKDEDGVIEQHSAAVRQQRTLFFPEAGGDAKFLTKDVSGQGAELVKSRLYKDIFFLSQVPNLTDESFSANLSGVAMKYKLLGLEELTQEKENYWISSETKKLRLMVDYINRTQSANFDADTIEMSFDRSQIANLLEITQMMGNLSGVLSKETVAELWPGVEDGATEVEKLREESAGTENTTALY